MTTWPPATHQDVQDAVGFLRSAALNAFAYGAKGDGSTDDRAAIQAALDAAAAAGGGVVYLPAGTYIINKYLTIGSKVRLVGAGMSVTTIKCGSTFTAGGTAPLGGGYSMIQVAALNQTDVAISDFTCDGNESANRATLSVAGSRLSSYLIDMRNVTGLRIERVATRNSWTYNIMVLSCSQFAVTGCDVRSPNTTGVYNQLDGIHILGSNAGRVAGNYVDNGIGGDADDGLVCHVLSGGTAAYDIVYADNTVRGGTNGSGIQIAGDTVLIRDVTISGNNFWGSPTGIHIGFYAGTGNQPIRSVSIVGNTIRDCTTGHAIWIEAQSDGKWEDLSIVGNTIDGYGNATNQFEMAISVDGGNSSRGIAIVGNNIRNGYSRAIFFSEGQQVRDYVIADNVVDMTTSGAAPLAIMTGYARDGSIVGNVLTGRAGLDGIGIYIESTATFQATNQIVTGNRVRSFNQGITVTNAAGNYPTNTIVTSNITQGCTTGTSFGTATVTSANNL